MYIYVRTWNYDVLLDGEPMNIARQITKYEEKGFSREKPK